VHTYQLIRIDGVITQNCNARRKENKERKKNKFHDFRWHPQNKRSIKRGMSCLHCQNTCILFIKSVYSCYFTPLGEDCRLQVRVNPHWVPGWSIRIRLWLSCGGPLDNAPVFHLVGNNTIAHGTIEVLLITSEWCIFPFLHMEEMVYQIKSKRVFFFHASREVTRMHIFLCLVQLTE
jgi:hypothetical protein